jgi:hypothetical protein
MLQLMVEGQRLQLLLGFETEEVTPITCSTKNVVCTKILNACNFSRN